MSPSLAESAGEPFKVYNSVPNKAQPLYHYTSAIGLHGMLKDRCLWLTDLNYLNDASEGKIVVNVIKEVIASYGAFDIDEELLLAALGKTYSFSLTEAKDSLNQWRAYCPNGGYCISLDLYQLDFFLGAGSLSIGQCVYDREKQKAFVEKYILPALVFRPQGKLHDPVLVKGLGVPLQQVIADNIRQYRRELALFKDDAFEDEKEWRIISTSLVIYPDTRRLDELLNFRINKDKLIPYRKYNFTRKTHGEMLYGLYVKDPERIVDGVVISPNLYPELEISACYQLLDRYNYGPNLEHSDVEPKKSVIPYRISL